MTIRISFRAYCVRHEKKKEERKKKEEQEKDKPRGRERISIFTTSSVRPSVIPFPPTPVYPFDDHPSQHPPSLRTRSIYVPKKDAGCGVPKSHTAVNRS